MKIIGIKILLFSTLFGLSTTSEAQFIKKLKQAASQGMENAIEQKVEEEAQKMMARQLEKQLAGLYGEDAQGAPVNFDMNKILAGIGEEVPTADSYEFTGFVTMELETKDEKGKSMDPITMKSFLGQNSEYTGMEISDPKNPNTITIMIFDMENKASILLMENEETKNSFAYKLDFDDVLDETSVSVEESNFKIEKTGNTKDILGYTCDEYFVKSEDGQGTYWITEDLINGSNSFWSSNSPFASSKMQEKYADHFANMPKGNFMEMDFTSTDGSEVMMKVIDIQASQPKTFKMSDYPNMMQSMKQQ
ncbi:DUF4412 domain-containing protein [Algoriphagus marinus]|uniref:DUF4412 domain-containing protein n=1 Tax=Algoriphagus marinus TaxID=1925762 RepID=UPI00094B94B7|nr:DUF4412 domain-containing protein [Algoriphagus marinus]